MRRTVGLAVVAALAAAWIWAWPLLRPFFAGGAQAAASLLERLGAWGPLAVIGLQVLQAVISPLPAWPVTLAAGALYGTVAGAAYALIGGTIGATINFWLARAYGRPFVARHVDRRWIGWADRISAWHVALATVVIRILPFLSFDFVAYVAGISRISYLPFLAAIAVGQIPGLLAYAFVGNDLAAAQTAGNWVAGGVLIAVILGWLGARWMRKQAPS
jgi:uncharacterized membrane protein YdjX (TVP38/TMEM64 family)